MIRKAKAVWQGTGRDGTGNLSSESGVLAGTPYSFKTRFENEKGTNPEELIAAAHAGCFTMALAFGLQLAGFTPTSCRRKPPSRSSRKARDFKISQSALTLARQGAEPRRSRFRQDRRRGREELSGVEGAQRRDHAGRQIDLIQHRERCHASQESASPTSAG